MHRKFYIENENQEKFDITSMQCFFTPSSGFGLSKNITYIRVGASFAKDNEEDNQNIISGTITFFEKPYDTYRNLIDFIELAGTLKLIYIPGYEEKTKKEYYRDIDLTEIGKDQVSQNGFLECQITFNCKSMFYTAEQQKFIVEPLSDEPRFDTAYWGVIFNDYSSREVVIENTGHVDAALKLVMYGYLINPSVELWYKNELYAKLEVNATIDENERLCYSSLDDDIYIYNLKPDGTKVNLVNSLNLQNDNFFKLPKGTSIIKILADNGVETKITLEVLKAYKAV